MTNIDNVTILDINKCKKAFLLIKPKRANIMHTSINNEYQFLDHCRQFDRDDFSYKGLKLLYLMIENYEECSEESMEIDFIALCCEFSEYEAEELTNDYGYLLEDDQEYIEASESEKIELLANELRQNTWVATEDEQTFIIQNF